MKMAKCREMFAEFPVDAAAAKENVPPGYTSGLIKAAWRTMLLMVQDCEEGILDSLLRIRPMRMSHIWIEIDGPEETALPLPGLRGLCLRPIIIFSRISLKVAWPISALPLPELTVNW